MDFDEISSHICMGMFILYIRLLFTSYFNRSEKKNIYALLEQWVRIFLPFCTF